MSEKIAIAFDETVREILGKPNFACSPIASILRLGGMEIKRKAEDEQACVLYWLLEMYCKHGENWLSEGDKYLTAIVKEQSDE